MEDQLGQSSLINLYTKKYKYAICIFIICVILLLLSVLLSEMWVKCWFLFWKKNGNKDLDLQICPKYGKRIEIEGRKNWNH